MRPSRRSKKNGKPSAEDDEQVAGVFRGIGSFRTGFPKKLRFRHRYVDLLAVTGTTGATVKQQFSCNGMFDPDITNVGHQPMYFDTCTGIYDHYTVFKSRLTIQIVADKAFRASLYVDDDTSTPAGAIQAAEQPSSAMFRVSPATSVRPLVMSRTWDAKQYFGGDIFDNDALQGTSAANPTEQSYYTALLAAADGTSTVVFSIGVELEYEAVWDELVTQGQS